MADEAAFRVVVVEQAEAGSALLAPLLTAAGFTGPNIEVARGSGGPAAVASWDRADGMSFETHVRTSLGIVRYEWHGDGFDHRDYLRVRQRQGRYPGFSEDPQEAFAHVLADLQGVAADVFDLSEDEFKAVAAAVRDLPRRQLP